LLSLLARIFVLAAEEGLSLRGWYCSMSPRPLISIGSRSSHTAGKPDEVNAQKYCFD